MNVRVSERVAMRIRHMTTPRVDTIWFDNAADLVRAMDINNETGQMYDIGVHVTKIVPMAPQSPTFEIMTRAEAVAHLSD